MGEVNSVGGIDALYPGVSKILGLWFSNYKGIGGGVSSKGLVNGNTWALLDTGMNLFSKMYEGGSVKSAFAGRHASQFRINRIHSTTQITIFLENQQDVNVAVFAPSGRKLVTLMSGNLASGSHTVLWNNGNCTPGCYLVKLQTPTATSVQMVPVSK
jgi:hypothetical protein